ncbi:MAG: hypothetical protein JOZ81_17855 [Chloroflexi bacterium]|nr:hypothetical protein [Chloroflexota bacterium]
MASDSAIAALLERGPIAHTPHHVFVTTLGFPDRVGLRELTDILMLTRLRPAYD